MKRYECLKAIAPLIKDDLFITTANGATTEWNGVTPSDGNIQVKTLGLCSSISLGNALSLPKRKIFVFDGDGALWMSWDRWQPSRCINRKISFTLGQQAVRILRRRAHGRYCGQNRFRRCSAQRRHPGLAFGNDH
jgi:hypothetical protein